jgi:GT2 family glycosyltransferase
MASTPEETIDVAVVGTSSGDGRDRVLVTAVLVTYNRCTLLLESLAAVHGQSRPPDSVIVIDNASTDGTAAEVRARFPTVHLVELPCNTGGAGGFAYGLAHALAQGIDLVWLMDDDTIPEERALAEMLDARTRHPGRPPALVASRVLWTDRRPHPMNTPRTKPFATKAERAAAAAAGCLPIRSASFVSILIDAQICRERGLPLADYFLWNDDFEFTARILRGNPGLLCPASVVIHKTKTFGSTDTDPGERFFFEVRNKVWTLRSRSPLAAHERLLYGGATLRRWVRTFARSGSRHTLRVSLVRGLAAGVRTHPRPTGDVFESLGLKLPVADGLADLPGRAAAR